MIITTANWTEIAATLICTGCLLHKPSVINRWFVWFLWLTLSVELNGKLTTDMILVKYTVYNTFTLLEFAFYSGLFYQITRSKKSKFSIKVFFIPVLVFFICNLIWGEGYEKYNGLTRCLTLLILTIYCLLYYTEAAKSDVVRNYKWGPFVIITGCFIFFTGNFVLALYFNYIAKNVPNDLVQLYRAINGNLAVFLYCMLSIGFLIEALAFFKKR